MEQKLERIYRRKDLMAFLGYGTTVIDDMIARGDLPRPIKLRDGGRAVGWRESDLMPYIKKRDALSREPVIPKGLLVANPVLRRKKAREAAAASVRAAKARRRK